MRWWPDRTDRLKLAGQLVEVLAVNFGVMVDLRVVLLDAYFDLAHMLQGQIPAALQFCSDEAVFRVRGVILPLRPFGGIAGRLQVALESFQNIIPLPGMFFLSLHRSFDSCGLDHAKDLSADSCMYSQTAEGYTSRFAVIEPSADAGVA